MQYEAPYIFFFIVTYKVSIGANCSFPLNKPCSTTTPNYIVSNVSTGQYVNPSLTYTYLSKASSTALLVNLTTDMPTVPTKLDVLFLVDVTRSITTPMLSFFQEVYAKTFFDSVRRIIPNSLFGVSTFTDRPNGGTGCTDSDYPFRLHLPLSSEYVRYYLFCVQPFLHLLTM